MRFDDSFNIVYPSWASFSYTWERLPSLLDDPLVSVHAKHYPYDWQRMGYSRITNNYSLHDGPFGNGIIRYDPSKLVDTEKKDAWLPIIVLGSEATLETPPGIPKFEWRDFRVSYLSPKPSDEERLGLKKQKNDPMPYFSVETWPGMELSAMVCLGFTKKARLGAELREFPLWLRAWELKAELWDEDKPPCAAVVEKFFAKWELKDTWYFVGTAGCDAGLFLAILVYLGGYLRSRRPQLKSVHMVTTLTTEVRMCSKWNPQKLR